MEEDRQNAGAQRMQADNLLISLCPLASFLTTFPAEVLLGVFMCAVGVEGCVLSLTLKRLRYYIQRSPAQCTRLVPLWEIRILQDLFYSPYAQAGKDFFLAEVVYEAIGRFDDSMWTETAVPYHKDDEA